MKYFILFLLLSCSIFSQTTTTGYKLIRDETDTKFAFGNLGLVNLQISGSRMSLAGGPGIKFYAKGIYVTADYEYHYLDGLADAIKANSNTAYSVYKPQNSRNAQASIAYLFRKVKEKKVKMYVKSQGGMHTVTHYYANVDAHVSQFFGLEFGYKSGFSNITIAPNVTTKDNYNNLPGPSGMTTTMMYNCISFGPSYGKTEDVIADIETYGVRKSQFFSRVYANVLFAPSVKFEDVYIKKEIVASTGSSATYLFRYQVDGNIDVSRLGFNIGYETYKFNRFGASTKLELGMLPGVKEDLMGNIYFSFKVGLSFGKVF